MHYVYIVCFWLIISWTMVAAIPPWTVSWHEYMLKHNKKESMGATVAIFVSTPSLIIGFKLALIFVNYLGW